MHAEKLTVNFLSRPLGVPGDQVRFSWWVKDGERQTAYQIQLRGDAKWDSGLVRSAQAQLIPGPALPAGKHFEWRVRLTDQDGKAGSWAPWEPLGTALKKWPAPWIQVPFDGPEPQGAHNGYHSEMEYSADVEKWVEIELPETTAIDGFRIFPARPFDFSRDVPGFLFPAQFRVEVGGKVVYQTATNVAIPANHAPLTISLPKTTGRRVRVIFTRLRERDSGVYGVAMAEMQLLRADRVISQGAAVTAKDSVEHNHWSTENLTNGDLTSHPVQGLDPLPAAYFRRLVRLKSKIKRATLRATALGCYEFFINGERIGDEILAPGWTDYHRRVRYQTFDVTRLVVAGGNELRATLGDGWYAGRIGMSQMLDARGFPRAIYGRIPALSAVLTVDFEDGTSQTIVTDGKWAGNNDGPIRSSDIYDGEVYDARKPIVPMPGGTVHVVRFKTAVEPQSDQPIRITDRVNPTKILDHPKGKLLDFGQNLVGRLSLQLKGPEGAVVNVHHVEMLDESGDIYAANLRGAPQIDRITLDANGTNFEPRFTYHGFRYALVELPPDTKLESAQAHVFHTAAPETAKLETSDRMVNRLWQNIRWTTRANLMSTATDCPQRDERLGWTGDLHAFGHTANFLMDLSAFTEKWLLDMRDAQAEDGRFPDIAPHPFGKDRHFTGAPGWGDAAVSVAWHRYLRSGDTRQIKDHLPEIARYLAWLKGANPNFLWQNHRHNDYGDWLNGDTLRRDGWDSTGSELPKEVFATLMWHFSLTQAADLAAAVGQQKQAETWRKEATSVAAAFRREYVEADGKIRGDTQAGYAFALDIDILPESDRPAAFRHLVAALERRQNHLTTGFHTTHRLMNVLTRFGRSDLCYTLLENRTFPSWGYTIDNGATTIWERWDGFVKGRGFQDPGMNSFNHWALGAVGEWMMQTLVGITPIDPGWTHFRICPVPGGTLEWAEGEFDAPTGRILSSWKKVDGKTTYRFTIPPNTSAEVVLPGLSPETLGPGTYVRER